MALPMLDYVDEFSKIERIKELLGPRFVSVEKLESTLNKLENEMKTSAQNLEFEKAAELRDVIRQVRALSLDL